MPTNRSGGKNMNIGNQNIVGNTKDEYDISGALQETNKQLKITIALMHELVNSTGGFGKEAKSAFSSGTTQSFFDDLKDSKNLLNSIKKEYQDTLRIKKEEQAAEKDYQNSLKLARTSEAKHNVQRRRWLAEQNKELNNQLEAYKKREHVYVNKNGKEVRTGQFHALGGEINSRTGEKYTPGELMSKVDSKSAPEELMSKITAYEEESLELQENFGKQNVSATTIALDGLKKAGTQILNEMKQELTKGINDFCSFYESNFTEIAARTGTGGDRSATRDVFKGARAEAKQYGGALNFNNEVLPQLMDLTRAGLQGEELYAKASEAALDKKIMPWLNETSQTWLTISSKMDNQTQAQYKNMQFAMQDSKSGNRLLQSGVIDKLNGDIYPVLQSIDFNTVDKENLPAEMLALMESYTEQGFDPQEAYQAAKDAYDISGDMFGALTTGDTSKKIQALNQMQYGLGEGAARTQNYFAQMMAGAGSDIGASAIGGILGGRRFVKGGYMTTENAAGSVVSLGSYEKNVKDLQVASQSTDRYDENVKNADQYNTITQQFKNYVENFGSAVGQFASAIPGGNMLANIGTEVAGQLISHGIEKVGGNLLGKVTGKIAGDVGGDVAGKLASKVGGKVIEKVGGEVAKEAGTKALASVGKTIGKGLVKGGIKAGGASTATAAVAGVAGLAAGAYMMGKDAHEAGKKAGEWGTSESSAKLAGAFFGAEDQPSVKNTLKQTAKYAAIGAGIGSFIPGVGTVIGGAVGAGVGAISSVVNGKDVAQWIDKQKEKAADNKAFNRQLKLAKAEGKGDKSTVKKILKSVNNIEKEISKTGGSTLADRVSGNIGASAIGGLLGSNAERGGFLGRALNVATPLGIISNILGLNNENGGNSILSLIGQSIVASPLGAIAERLGFNANENRDDTKNEKTLTYGESQIVDTIREIGENVVAAINDMNPTKNEIDYQAGLYKATHKGMTYNSMVNLWSDTQKEDTTTA